MDARRLKIIAVVTMTIDHIGVALNALDRYAAAGMNIGGQVSDAYWQCRMIGRLAFPIFAFLIAEGCAHTRDIKAYIKRLSLFAVISQLPYQLLHNIEAGADNLLYFTGCSVMVTLTMGACAVYCYRAMLKDDEKKALWALGIAATFAIVMILGGEYDIGGVAIILAVYMLRPKEDSTPDAAVPGSIGLQITACAALTLAYYLLAMPSSVVMAAAAALSAVPLSFYNGRPGNRKGGLVFYAFYPSHLLVLVAFLYIAMR